MSSVAVDQIPKLEKDQLVCTYAALLLHDDGQEVTAEKLSKVIKASGNEVESFWPAMFAKALQGQNIEELLTKLSSVAVAAGPAVSGGDAPAEKKADAKKEDKKEEKEEEADVDMGGLFGDDY